MTISDFARLKPGDTVREKKSGVTAKVIDAFLDGVLYLDDGSRGISPLSAYNWEDFDTLPEEATR